MMIMPYSTQKNPLEKSKRPVRKNAWGNFKVGAKQLALATSISFGFGMACFLAGSTFGEVAYYASKNGPAAVSHYHEITKKVDREQCGKFNAAHNGEIRAALSQWHPSVRDRLGKIIYYSNANDSAAAKFSTDTRNIAVKASAANVTNSVNHEIAHSLFNTIMSGKDEEKKVRLLEVCERLVRKNDAAVIRTQNSYMLDGDKLDDFITDAEVFIRHSMDRSEALLKVVSVLLDSKDKLSDEESEKIKEYLDIMHLVFGRNGQSFAAVRSALEMKGDLIKDLLAGNISHSSYDVFANVAGSSVREATRQLRVNVLVEQKLSLEIIGIAKGQMGSRWESVAGITEARVAKDMEKEKELITLIDKWQAYLVEVVREEVFANAVMGLLGTLDKDDVKVELDDYIMDYLATLDVGGVKVLEKAMETQAVMA